MSAFFAKQHKVQLCMIEVLIVFHSRKNDEVNKALSPFASQFNGKEELFVSIGVAN